MSSPLPGCHTRVQPSPPPGTHRLCRKATAGTSRSWPRHRALAQQWDAPGASLELARLGWEAGTRVLRKVPRPAATGEGLGSEEWPPAPSLPSKSCGSPASGEALFWRWSREPSPNPLESPAPHRSQPLPWNAEPPPHPGPSPQTKCLLYELHVNCFPATAASTGLAPAQSRGTQAQPGGTCSVLLCP